MGARTSRAHRPRGVITSLLLLGNDAKVGRTGCGNAEHLLLILLLFFLLLLLLFFFAIEYFQNVPI